MEPAQSCKRRLEHMLERENLPDTAQKQWKKKRLDRMLVEYFLRAGYYKTAIQLASHSDIQVRDSSTSLAASNTDQI